MAIWVQVLEMADGYGQPSGRYRLVEKSDELNFSPYGLCECENGHESCQAAKDCPEAIKNKPRY